MRDLAAETRIECVMVPWPEDLGVEHFACGIVTLQFRSDPDDHPRTYMPINWSTLDEVVKRRCRLAQNELQGMQDAEVRMQRAEHLHTIPKVLLPALHEVNDAISGRLTLSQEQMERSLTLYLQPLPSPGEPASDWRIRLVLGHW